jgi:hypothetical protein
MCWRGLKRRWSVWPSNTVCPVQRRKDGNPAAILKVTLAKEEVALAAEKGLLKALSKADCICY